ncbi:MAG: hypothetical protein MUE41_00625 [Gemmatimonadaceae bacterium]|jgi:hypothetical protein|nr:hypothetical protein [Gemmatimonadaceae bacterium]
MKPRLVVGACAVVTVVTAFPVAAQVAQVTLTTRVRDQVIATEKADATADTLLTGIAIDAGGVSARIRTRTEFRTGRVAAYEMEASVPTGEQRVRIDVGDTTAAVTYDIGGTRGEQTLALVAGRPVLVYQNLAFAMLARQVLALAPPAPSDTTPVPVQVVVVDVLRVQQWTVQRTGAGSVALVADTGLRLEFEGTDTAFRAMRVPSQSLVVTPDR